MIPFRHLLAASLLLIGFPDAGLSQTQPDLETIKAMTHECDSFLAAMPAERQHRQALAVRAAMRGDTAALRDIRRSRSQAPALPNGVEARYVRPDLCLFIPTRTAGRTGDKTGQSETAGRTDAAGRTEGAARTKTAMQPARLRPALLYLHGGGWAFGSINSCTSFCAAVALAGDCIVAALDYRLAPAHPYPAALDDTREAFRLLRTEGTAWGIDTARVSIGGDSAGGNLAFAAAMTLSGVRSIVPIYPVTLLYEAPSASWTRYAKGYGNDAELLLAFEEAYAGGRAREPLASVGLASDSMLRRLPSAWVISAERDILLDQTTALVARIRRLGTVPVTQRVYPGTTHLFITVPGQPTAFRRAVEETARFIGGAAQ